RCDRIEGDRLGRKDRARIRSGPGGSAGGSARSHAGRCVATRTPCGCSARLGLREPLVALGSSRAGGRLRSLPMMHSETPTAVERDEEPATVPPRSTEETEALLAEERHRAQLEFFEHHRQIADLTSLARVDKAELERLRKTASEASKRIARLEEELAAERERSNALAAIRKWHGELGTLRDAELTTVTAARDALERYRIRKASRTLSAVEGS